MRASESLLDLAFVALDHAVDTVRHGDQLAPFALVEAEVGRDLARFVNGTLEASIAEARRYLWGRPDAIRAALAYDGFITLDGTRYDAVFVEAQEAGQDSAIVLCQRYEPKRRRRAFRTIGNPGDAGDAGPLLGQNSRTAG
jgi:hypothetical protein